MVRFAVLLLAVPLLHAQFTIQPGQSANQSFHLKNGTLDAEGQTLEQLLQFAYHLETGCVIGPAWISEKTFDIHGTAGPEEKIRPLLEQALANHFKLSVRKEIRPMDVYVLTGSLASATATEDGENMSHIRGTNLSPESIARYLSSWLGKPVLDETGLKGRYTVDITWDATNSANLIPAVERAGLHLQKDRRPVEVLVVAEN
jgi:uncharacterized protein (TIGR03435 family)